MTENRFTDELLSAIIDGEASPESVASVEADPDARQRLADMRAAVAHVAEPVPEATPARRAQSIAAAMAAATPASPEVASLSAQRHKRDESQKQGLPKGWLIAAAAAVLLFVLAIPTLFINGDTATSLADADATATQDDDVVDEAADVVRDEVGDDVVVDAADGDTIDEDADDGAADEEAAIAPSAEEATEETAEVAADEADAADDSEESNDIESDVATEIEIVTSVEEFEELLAQDVIAPQLASDDILSLDGLTARTTSSAEAALATEVNPACLTPGDDVTNPTPYSLIVLDPFAGAASLVVVEFADDGTTRLLDAETCAVIG